jgi:two-component system LytT family sensor kinase
MKKSVVISLHFGYWLFYFLLLSILVLANLQNQNHFSVNSFWRYLFCKPIGVLLIVPGVIGFYSFYCLLFIKYLVKRKIYSLFISGILTSIFAALITSSILATIFGTKTMVFDGANSFFGELVAMILLALVHGIIGLVLKGFIVGYDDMKVKEELNKKNYEMELSLIKSQIDPHFLFNTINNIDTLIQMDAIKASQYLNKLSDIMRFMLYETKIEKILLEKEVSYIYKYVELQKIRTSNPNYVDFVIEGSTENRFIAPMVFIPFIENAFKHTTNKKIDKAIKIKITILKNEMVFECENSYGLKPILVDDFSGLGNELIQRRLSLLYPDKYQLNINDQNGVYKVKLVISV